MSQADSNLDMHLRAVDIPDGLLDRLRAIPLADDEGIDAALNDVVVPGNLMARLKAIPLADDAGLDEALRDVPVPKKLKRVLQRPKRRLTRTQRIGQWIMGVSLAVGATVAGLAIYISQRTLSHNGEQPSVARVIPTPPASTGADLTTSWATLSPNFDAGAASTASESTTGPSSSANGKATSVAEQSLADRGLPSAIEAHLAQFEPSSGAALSNSPSNLLSGKSPTKSSLDLVADNSARQSLGIPSQADPLLLPVDPSQNAGRTLGSSWDELPEISIRETTLVPHGLDWPLVPGAHREFLVLTGFHPFVSPAAHARLAACQTPLAVEATSYELTRRYLERNELPPPERVHTEDFLAAVPCDFPKPTGRSVGLTLAAAPSPISDGCLLLQVGVRARDAESDAHAAEHVIFLLDTSTSMHWGSRIEIVRKAMRSMTSWLGPNDRVSLVTFNQGAHVLVEDVRTENIGTFLNAVDSLSAEGATDVSAGLRVAYTLARQTTAPNHPPVRIVLLTDGLIDLDPAVAEEIEHRVTDAATHGIAFHAIDLGQQREGDPQLAALAQAGHGAIARAGDAAEVEWAMREIITGHSQVVASDARLQVTFNTKSVAEYRLLGHEANEWAGLLPATAQSDLHTSQTATALYEVRLAPGAAPAGMATAELAWYTPDADKRTLERATVQLNASGCADMLSRAVPSLQQSAAVAYAAEVLRHSPFLFRQPRPNVSAAMFHTAMSHALELARQVDSRINQQESFTEFVSLIGQEMKAHPATRRAGKP